MQQIYGVSFMVKWKLVNAPSAKKATTIKGLKFKFILQEEKSASLMNA